ncbi:hypothetical protein EYF80_051133 [Liparis tanakae]|uniref:Uncharacterized protein n=1 Tax=Liparis tanakae TaxID=230148 RepID=A0A4Z2FBZ1_9TELE|nr:hypothetical protein EYF80_051133 [Liparis tanakae]
MCTDTSDSLPSPNEEEMMEKVAAGVLCLADGSAIERSAKAKWQRAEEDYRYRTTGTRVFKELRGDGRPRRRGHRRKGGEIDVRGPKKEGRNDATILIDGANRHLESGSSKDYNRARIRDSAADCSVGVISV